MFSIVIEAGGAEKRRVQCLHRECGVGRGEENLVVLQGWDIASKHASLICEDEGVFLLPLAGRAAIKINSERVLHKHGPIRKNDEIRIADYTLRVLANEHVPANGHKAASAATTASPVEPEVQALPVASTQMVPVGNASADTSLWRRKLHAALVKKLDLRRFDVHSMGDQALRDLTINLIDEIIQNEFGDLPGYINPRKLGKEVLDEAIGLGPLEDLIADNSVTEIMVNAHDQIFIERSGRIEKSTVVFSDERMALAAIERIVTPLGRRIDESSPLVDARLKDGSRVNAVIPPVALRGPSISIRKFSKRRLLGEDLLKFGSLNAPMLEFLTIAVRERKNIVVSGGTGSGKTTLLNILSNFIPDGDRVVTIEDAAELKLVQPNLVSLEARPANMEGKGQISIRDLVRNALRMRPDRIVVGECRGGECLDMLQAMNTGHDGSLTTAHANNPRETLSRLEVMAMMAGMDLPIGVVREQISSAVNLIVHQRRYPCGSRKVSHITEITGMESGVIQMQDVFVFKPTSFHGPDGKVVGRFVATGAVPEFYEELAERGVAVDLGIFRNEGMEAR
ncbi:MAG: Flp pilus assembly complex ATPase component TadA [Pseudomonadales bacterium]|jgi:pilus assembly protein CpaF|nr:Flp pilus assembly complex ATPase component TadA [Pseudomonadales bacterium]